VRTLLHVLLLLLLTMMLMLILLVLLQLRLMLMLMLTRDPRPEGCLEEIRRRTAGGLCYCSGAH